MNIRRFHIRLPSRNTFVRQFEATYSIRVEQKYRNYRQMPLRNVLLYEFIENSLSRNQKKTLPLKIFIKDKISLFLFASC